jgi:hypothetical protein
MNTNNDNNNINATPEQGVIPFPYSSTSSPILVNVDSIVFGDNSSPVDPSLNSFEDTKVIDPEMDLIQKIKSLHGLIKTFEKNQEHWKIRKFKSVVEIGEHLVTIRKKCNEDKVGFKNLVETEFVNEFCYKTAIRYMFLFNKRSELPSDVCTTRKAFVSLGILKEEYQYPKEETPEVDPEFLSKFNISTPGSTTKQRRPRRRRDSVLLDEFTLYPESLVFTFIDTDHQTRLIQVFPSQDGKLVGRYVDRGTAVTPLNKDGSRWLYQKLKPFVEWYNRTNVDHEPPKINQSQNSDGPDLKIAA